MKKEQAKEIALKNAKVMVEYLEQFLNDDDTLTGKMNFSSENNQLVVDIFLSKKGKVFWKRHYSMGISSIYADLLTEEISSILLDTFMPSENFGVGEYAYLKDHPTLSRDGIYVFNGHGSRIDINFYAKEDNFSEIMDRHNSAISEYRNKGGITL